MRRGRLAVVAGLAGVVLAASAAAAATRSAVDRESGLRFRLEGKVLTVSLAPQPRRDPPDARDRVWGESVQAACSTSYLKPASRRVRADGLWPAGTDAVVFAFRRDISRSAKWCILEEPGGADIGFGALQPPPAQLLLQTRFGGRPELPGPRPLVRVRNAHGRLVIDRRARFVDRRLRPGRYRLTVAPEGAEPCGWRMRLGPRGRLALLVTVDPGRGCAIARVR